MNIASMIGFKFFKLDENDNLDLIRLVYAKNYKKGSAEDITIKDCNTGEIKKVKTSYLEGYTPLEPDGVIAFNICTMNNGKDVEKDVVIAAHKFLNIKIGDQMPWAVCRQSITDVFYNLIAKNEDDMRAGLAVNQDDCPANFDFRMMIAASGVSFSQVINFYRLDSMEDILSMVKVNKFDEVLKKLYDNHVISTKNPALQFKHQHHGWCDNLKLLIKENNFEYDINQMLGITMLDFNIEDNLVKKPLPGKENELFDAPSDEFLNWLKYQFRQNIENATFLKFDHDINLADFNNANYFLLKDINNNLYICVYTSGGQLLEADLKALSEKEDFSTKFRLNFYNKYNNNK